MKKLCEEQGTSIILITHNMGVVAEICDYVYVMYAGRVMEQAEWKLLPQAIDLIANGKIK